MGYRRRLFGTAVIAAAVVAAVAAGFLGWVALVAVALVVPAAVALTLWLLAGPSRGRSHPLKGVGHP